MRKRAISEGWRFSFKDPVREPLLEGERLVSFVLYFEAGQSFVPEAGEASYQVLEGDALLNGPEGEERARKGQLVIGAPTRIENLGGGLLVVLETRARGSSPAAS